ncbi:MAG: hypothetical protein R6U29_07115 [Desulfosudaceae bacterium]
MLPCTRDYAHPEINQEVNAIGGHYVVIREERLPFQGEEVLYFVGHGIADRTCCGFGAFCYVTVAGYVRHWQYTRDDQGRPVTKVEPVTRAVDQKLIQKQIKQQESMVNQVNFLPPEESPVSG